MRSSVQHVDPTMSTTGDICCADERGGWGYQVGTSALPSTCCDKWHSNLFKNIFLFFILNVSGCSKTFTTFQFNIRWDPNYFRVFKINLDIIITGKEARDEWKKECRARLDICAGFQEYATKLLRIVEEDEEHNNQQETGM